jgi:hypothetical protein
MTNKSILGLLLSCSITSPVVAGDYHDITSNYLQNTAFDTNFDHKVGEEGNVSKEILEIDGWTKNISVDYTIAGVYQFGTAKTFNRAAIPSTGYDGTINGGCLALSTGWTQSMLYEQQVTLPAGKYALVTVAYNCGTSTVGTSKAGWLPTGKTAVMSKVGEYPLQTWVADTVWFELTASTTGNIQIGYQSGAEGSDNSAKLAIDFVKLLRNTPIGKVDVDLYKETLSPVIAEAETLYGDGSGNEAEALATAIGEAKAVLADADATMDGVKEAIDKLNAAIDSYQWANPTGETPSVTTDSRFARGATMAFARMTATGSDIVEQGICWAEHDNPTINDSRTTKYLENNGKIYRLDDLTPATMYYMRAYAITKGRNVGYGDAIKFCTIPKGSIGYTIRDGGDADAVKRITSAVKSAVNYWNNLTSITGFTTSVGYNSGVPTAECSYGGWMSVGSNSSYQATGTILHELLHGVGVLPWADTEWSRHNLRASVTSDGYGTGLWLGDRVTEVLRFWDNSTTSQLSGDYQHMWPYGINGAHEDNGSEVLYIGNGLICQALGEDGLQHTKQSFARPYYSFNHQEGEKYYIKNESQDGGLYSSYLAADQQGNLVWRTMGAAEAVANDSAAWLLTFTPSNQYYQLKNAATGRYMSYIGSGSNGIKTVAKSSASDAEDFQLMKGRVDVAMGGSNTGKRGYWIINPASNWTPQCLQASANGATTAATFNIANSAAAQRWLIMGADEMTQMEEYAIEGMKTQVADVLAELKKLVAVPHIEDVEGTDDKANATISSVEQALANVSTPQEGLLLEAEVKTAVLDFLNGATPTDVARPFDLTYLLANPGMDATDGWSTAANLGYSCGEFYQKTANMNQTISYLPAGTYQFCANAFQRPGAYADVYEPYQSGTDNITAYLYAGSEKLKLCNICRDAQTEKLGGNEKEATTGLYIPDNMEAASLYFAKGLYGNRVTTTLATSGKMKMGLSITSAPSGYWCIFDNFRLLFFGRMDKETLAGIQSATVPAANRSGKVFTIDGRQVLTNGQGFDTLPHGIYIVDGKKVVK